MTCIGCKNLIIQEEYDLFLFYFCLKTEDDKPVGFECPLGIEEPIRCSFYVENENKRDNELGMKLKALKWPEGPVA